MLKPRTLKTRPGKKKWKIKELGLLEYLVVVEPFIFWLGVVWAFMFFFSVINFLWYWPISFSVNLVEFKALVYDLARASGAEIARESDPDLVVKHSPQHKRENEKVRKISLFFILEQKRVRALYNPRNQDHVLQL